MEAASVRILSSANSALLLKTHSLRYSLKLHPFSPVSRSLPLSGTTHCGHYTLKSHSNPTTIPSSIYPSLSPPPLLPQNPIPLGLLSTPYSSNASFSSGAGDRFARIFSGSDSHSLDWNFASEDIKDPNLGFAGDKKPVVAVLLLGWLGAKRKHLKRYAELYNSKGIHAVSFVASVRDVLSFDLGRRLQERISVLARELASWLSETEKDGRERLLLTHTFSNTGWLVYGAILDNWEDREDLLQKIKGCVVDSGGDPELKPNVWAAGFTVALLKKWSSSTYPLVNGGEVNELASGDTASKIQEKGPPFIEIIFLVAFKKLFSFLLNIPDVNRRLKKIISTLSEKQPSCPQLYLYSTADKVIPFQSVESFIEDQKRIGRHVLAFNFGLSPHVDHYRTFPAIYASQIQNFLAVCFAVVKQM